MTDVERASIVVETTADDYAPPETYELSMFGTVSREQAVQIRRELRAQDRDHRFAWEDARRAAGMVWTASYWRYQIPCTDEFFSLDDAIVFLAKGEDEGELTAISITAPDRIVLPYEELQLGRQPLANRPLRHCIGPAPFREGQASAPGDVPVSVEHDD